MQSVQVSSASVAHVIHPSSYRVAVLSRRVKLPNATAALMAELAYGAIYREQDGSLPIAFGGREAR